MDTRDSHDPKVPARLSASRPLPAEMREPAPGRPASPGLNLRVILRAVGRFWWQILAVWIIGSAALVALVYSQVKPVYEAAALLKADPGTQDLFGLRIQSNEALGSYLETQVQLITSVNVLTDVATRLDRGLETCRKARNGDVITALRKALQVGVIPGTNLIRVSMRSASPDEAAVIVNQVVDSFIRTQGEYNESLTKGQIKSLEAYEKDYKRELERQNEAWQSLVEKSDADPQTGPPKPGGEGDGEKKPSDADHKSIRQQLTATTLELVQAQALLDRRRADPKAPEDARVKLVRQIEDRLSVDPDLRTIQEEVRKAEGALQAARRLTRNPQSDPAAVHATQKAIEGRARYWDLRKQKEPMLREALAAQGNDPDREYREAKQKVESLKAIRDGLKQELEKARTERRGNSSTAVKISQAKEERDYYRELLVAVSKRLQQLKFDQLKGETKITPIDPARPAGEPVSDRRMRMAAAIPVGLLGCLMGLALIAELRSGRVSHPDEIAPMLPVEVFSVPPLPMQRASRKPEEQAGLIELFAQRLDHLRVALGIDSVAGQDGRCVMITSAAGGEGKTTLSAQLAGRCASAGARTLLIDADLRRAMLSRMLDVPQGVGLVDVLEGKVEAEEAIVNIDGAGALFLLPVGAPGQDPSRVLRGPELGQLLERLRPDFELILIDTPPVLPVPDALTVGQWVDGALIAARSNTSRYTFVGRASRLLAAARIPVLGVVVNGVPAESGYGNYAYRYRDPRAVAASSDAGPDGPRRGAGA